MPGQYGLQCVEVGFRLTGGPDVGTVIPMTFVVSETSPAFAVGERVVLNYQEGAELQFRYGYADRQRRPVLLWLAVAFAVVVVILGRMRGFAALLGLGASVVVLLQFVIPAILDGRNPVLVAVVGSGAIAYLALYAAHGFTRMTTVALLGTLVALGLTAILSWLVVEAAQFSGLTVDEAFIITIAGSFDLSGLILAGVVLGALGAIDDITVTQASTVWELHALRPDLGRRGLVRSAMKVGRDHVASTVNTLLLAYAGAAMPLLLFFVLAGQSIGTILNSEIVAVEVVRTLVGSIGLVAAVPITTWLSAAFVSLGVGSPWADPPRERQPQPSIFYRGRCSSRSRGFANSLDRGSGAYSGRLSQSWTSALASRARMSRAATAPSPAEMIAWLRVGRVERPTA